MDDDLRPKAFLMTPLDVLGFADLDVAPPWVIAYAMDIIEDPPRYGLDMAIAAAVLIALRALEKGRERGAQFSHLFGGPSRTLLANGVEAEKPREVDNALRLYDEALRRVEAARLI